MSTYCHLSPIALLQVSVAVTMSHRKGLIEIICGLEAIGLFGHPLSRRFCVHPYHNGRGSSKGFFKFYEKIPKYKENIFCILSNVHKTIWWSTGCYTAPHYKGLSVPYILVLDHTIPSDGSVLTGSVARDGNDVQI